MFLMRFVVFILLSFFPVSLQAKAVWGTVNPEFSKEKSVEIWGAEEQNNDSFDTAFLFFNNEKDEQKTTEPLPLWLKNAVAIPDVPADMPKIAIVIDDVGLNRNVTRNIVSLPAPLTLAFLPYHNHLNQQVKWATESGHELIVHAPMQPFSEKHDPGKWALYSDMTADEIRANLNKMLDSFDGYVGINNHMGSKFTSDEKRMQVVLSELKSRGLLFLDSLTARSSVGVKVATEKNVPYAVRNVFLDNSKDEEKILNQLELLEEHALKHNVAIGIGHPYSQTIHALKKWIPQAKEKGFVFIPISMATILLQDENSISPTINEYDERR